MSTSHTRNSPESTGLRTRTALKGRGGQCWLQAQMLALMLLFGLMLSLPALAQNAPNAAEYLAATGPRDASVSVFDTLVNGFFSNPLGNFGTPTSLMGTLFLVFNGFVFVIALIWMSYGVIFKVVSTASTGEVLGSKLSATWMPIRYITGVAGIVPVFGGFSLSQVLLVTVAALGIGVTNFAMNQVLAGTAQFQALVAPMTTGTKGVLALESAAETLWKAHVCAAEIERSNKASTAAGLAPISVVEQPLSTEGGTVYVVGTRIGTERNPDMCGSVGFTMTGSERSGFSFGSQVGFRSDAVNYEAIAKAAGDRIKDGYVAGWPAFSAAIKRSAQEWHTSYWTAKTVSSQTMPQTPAVDRTAINSAVRAYASSINASVVAANKEGQASEGMITASAIAKMKEYGWMGLGAWYSTFAEANAALTESASRVKEATVDYKPSTQAHADLSVVMMAAESRSTDSQIQNGTGTPGTDSWTWLAVCKFIGIDTSTGNCSVGQSIVASAIGGAAEGSGGGDLVNPIIMFKNMGDYMMVIGEGMGVAAVFLDDAVGAQEATIAAGNQFVEKTSLMADAKGMSETTVGRITKVGGFVVKAAGSAVKGIIKMLPLLATVALGLGLLMSIYIPLIPFITWMGGVIQYCVVVVEGLVGMPIAALSHMDSEGEGLGQRTERGYIFLLNVAFRPILMVFGFFAASAIMIVLGTFQAKLFLPAIANVQGNSVTGLLSIFGFLVVFFVMNVALIQGLFNMIYLLPDQVLGLIGAGSASPIGKDNESKIHGLFVSGSRVTGSAVSALAPKDHPLKSRGPGGADLSPVAVKKNGNESDVEGR